MKLSKRAIVPALLIGLAVAISQIIDPDTLKAWTPWGIVAYALALFAHFEIRCDNISMDLEAVEEALDRVDPGTNHTSLRFRFPRQK